MGYTNKNTLMLNRYLRAVAIKVSSFSGLTREPIRLFVGLSATLLLGFLLNIQTVSALNTGDLKSIVKGTPFYKPDDSLKPVCPTGSATGGVAKPGPVYVVGDSIGTQYAPGLAVALNASAGSGWTVNPNVKSSRNLAGTPPAPDGLGAVDADKAFIATATTVIIELGTNPGGFADNTNIDSITAKIRSYAPSATVYWIDTAVINSPGVDKTAYANAMSQRNGQIISQSTPDKYTVIPWNKTVFGSNADPTHINPAAPDTNGYIRTDDGINVHLTPAGITAYTNMIVNTLKGVSGVTGGNGTTGGSCSCSSTLSGSDNESKIWNFLISKGLSGPQAAGIMGNLQTESGFDPTAEQAPGSWSDMSSEYIHAVGIAQWDGGRRPALITAATTKGVDPKDLGFQLDYLYTESSGRTQRDNPSAGEWDGLKLINDPGEAAYYWHYNFERSNDTRDKIADRMKNAVDILTKYGSSVSTGSGSGCSASNSGIVQSAILFSWPDKAPESIARIPKPEYAAALMQYNPNAPYAGADCGAFVGTVMRASGADPNYPLSYTPAQEAYVRGHPELYDVVDSTSVNDLQPGDILIVNGSSGGGGADGHTFIFVGAQPPSGYTIASASGGDRMANLGNPPTDANGIVNDSRGNYLRARLKKI